MPCYHQSLRAFYRTKHIVPFFYSRLMRRSIFKPFMYDRILLSPSLKKFSRYPNKLHAWISVPLHCEGLPLTKASCGSTSCTGRISALATFSIHNGSRNVPLDGANRKMIQCAFGNLLFRKYITTTCAKKFPNCFY